MIDVKIVSDFDVVSVIALESRFYDAIFPAFPKIFASKAFLSSVCS